ncbi:MAG TPA: hypothetical protein DC053_01190 [Lachnoclostridium sp.]|nr:hypothetical protein [Lachnoclostridium sp.]
MNKLAANTYTYRKYVLSAKLGMAWLNHNAYTNFLTIVLINCIIKIMKLPRNFYYPLLFPETLYNRP